eukprot:CAMPEP_0114552098 /NCGR_PEP_ID=MMETSP0114-20121206/6946_1 /TAXON_ID=31324 /ORGANISM="Goniomonas sp, Strain m" /LENGTH=407 /DNA_ID=CAMNT_0001736957 /DNA_START=24 /DNA_END=1251 /DNA_ORIENTATION=+
MRGRVLLVLLVCWVANCEGQCPAFDVSPTSWSLAPGGSGNLQIVLNQDATATVCVPNGASVTPSSVPAGGGNVVLGAGSFLGLAWITITVTEGPCVNTTQVPFFVDRSDVGVISVGQRCTTPSQNTTLGQQGTSPTVHMFFATFSAGCMNGAQQPSNGRCRTPPGLGTTAPPTTPPPSTTARMQPSSANLEVWYNFETADPYADSSGNGRTLALFNPSYTPSYPQGKFGTAFAPASMTHYRFTNGPVPVSGKLTLGVWIYQTSYTDFGNIYRRWMGAGPVASRFEIIFGITGTGSSGTINMHFHTNSGLLSITDTTVIPLNVWTHIGFVADGVSQVCTWVGATKRTCGSYDGSAVGSAQDYADLGGDGGGYPYLGRLDDFRLYTRALSDSEMAMLGAAYLIQTGRRW